MDIRIKLGERIRVLRKTKGLSQEKFAAICELDRTYIAGIELGKRNVSLLNIEKIASGLELRLEQLFEGL
ncbi:MAG: helix-turn-helix domain-containing protein [Flavobacteriales bacterium]|nr:helix-turn-helix domain-containing protein [Flavobacteriales bacterium]